MATITPNSITVPIGGTQQFAQTGITNPVWTLTGAGAVDAAGLYSAPTSGLGTAASLSVHSPFWGYNSANCYKRSDERLVTLSAAYDDNLAISAARLSAVGDYVEFTWYAGVYVMVLEGAGGGILGYTSYQGGWWGYSTGLEAAYSSFAVGDKILFQKTMSGILVYQNSILRHTFTESLSGTILMRIGITPSTPIGTIIEIPKVSGTGVTNYIEVAPAAITVVEANVIVHYRAHGTPSANFDPLEAFVDVSGNARHALAAVPFPIYRTNVVNGKSVLRFDGTKNPYKYNASFKVFQGFVVAACSDAANFSGYLGLLSDFTNYSILAGNSGTNKFFSSGYAYFEFRNNDRIRGAAEMFAPVGGTFALLTFRFWTGAQLNGIQIGQDRTFTARKWKGDVAEVILYDRILCESETRAKSQELATYYGLTLADAYPYQADKTGAPETTAQSVNFYDPPEGSRISEVLGTGKRSLDLQFSSRRTPEVQAMRAFHTAHYAPALACIYRDYKMIPPEDVEGYIDSPYELNGAVNNYEYGFRFKEK